MNASKSAAHSATSRRARKIKVAPVTRAIRMALAGTVLALGASGGAFAADCSTPGTSHMFCSSAQYDASMQPVIDLTRVHDRGSDARIQLGPNHGIARVGGCFGAAHGHGISSLGDPSHGDPTFAASNAQSFGAVQNLTAIGGGMPGPGGVAGSANAIGWDLSYAGNDPGGFAFSNGVPFAANAPDGFADAIFAPSSWALSPGRSYPPSPPRPAPPGPRGSRSRRTSMPRSTTTLASPRSPVATMAKPGACMPSPTPATPVSSMTV